MYKRQIPFDPQKPFVTSGIRLGTPAVTSRGLKEADIAVVADCIADIIDRGDEAIEPVKAKVEELCQRFPLYAQDILA